MTQAADLQIIRAGVEIGVPAARVHRALTEELQADLGSLAEAEATFGITAEIDLPTDRRAEFLAEAQAALTALAERYGAAPGGARATYRLRAACYPVPRPEGVTR